MHPSPSAIPEPASLAASALLSLPFAWSVVTALAAIAIAALLRRLGVSGSAIVAGLLAGILLGPGVVGRIAPEFGTAALAGTPTILESLRAIEREEAAFGLARGAPMMSGADTSALEEDLAARRAAAEEAWSAERERHAHARDLAVLVLAACVLFGSASSSSVRRPFRPKQTGEALLLAAWSILPVIALVALTLHLFGVSPLGPSALALGGAVVAGSWGLSRCDRRIARGVARDGAALVEQAARAASAVAIALTLVAIFTEQDMRLGHAAAIALACLPLGWCTLRSARPAVAALVERTALPALVSIAMLSIEPYLDLGASGLWIALILYLLIEDGRWVGASLAHWSAGRAGALGSMRLAIAGMASEPTTVALVGVGSATGILPAWLAAPALLAATGSAILAKPRAAAAERLASLESEIAAARSSEG